ncbi:hypothetical protein ACMFMG_006429 [Clarireedia jacksonii]
MLVLEARSAMCVMCGEALRRKSCNLFAFKAHASPDGTTGILCSRVLFSDFSGRNSSVQSRSSQFWVL